MKQRWAQALVDAHVPDVDIIDSMNSLKKSKKQMKQFGAEFSQCSYTASFNKQECFQNYTKDNISGAKTKVSVLQREGVVALIAELHKAKKYRSETLFIAFGILDKFLYQVVFHGLTVMDLDLVHLASVCLLMAAKLHQPLTPSFNQMIVHLDEEYRTDPDCKQKMIDLEFQIIHALQFDFQI